MPRKMMVKGASIKFGSFEESVPKILGLLKLGNEIKKYDKIVLKPWLSLKEEECTSVYFVKEVLKFVLENKNPVAEVFIAEGVDGWDTNEIFEKLGYGKLAEHYPVGLIDLNSAETEVVDNFEMVKFSGINYPKILMESFVISLPKLQEHEEFGILAGLSNMLGAYPAEFYSGFLSRGKNKIRKWPVKYSIHDIVQCKMPDFSVIDASEKGLILAGLSDEMDKQGARILGKDWKDFGYLKLIEETRVSNEKREADEKVY